MKKDANNMTIREWREAYKAGEFGSDMCAAGWYDWFCRESSLAGRLKRLAPLLNKITNDFILDNYRVWFKNNCPCVGPLYDDVRFEPVDESRRDELYFCVSFRDQREKSLWCLYNASNDYSEPVHGTNTSADMAKFINAMKF